MLKEMGWPIFWGSSSILGDINVGIDGLNMDSSYDLSKWRSMFHDGRMFNPIANEPFGDDSHHLVILMWGMVCSSVYHMNHNLYPIYRLDAPLNGDLRSTDLRTGDDPWDDPPSREKK